MLRDETGTGTFDRRWSGAQRLLMAVGLLGMTIGVATLRGPARGAESDPPAAAGVKAPAPRAGEMSFVPLYVPENMDGLVMLRPAATSRRIGMGRLVPLIREVLGVDLSDLSKDLKVDTSRPGHLKLGCEDIEWVTGGISFGRGKDVEKDNLHRLIIGSPTVRTVAPFDWLAFLGQWRFEFEEVRDGGHAYYKVKGPTAELLGPDPCVYLPDDRTLILDGEKAIRKLVGRDSPATPDYLRGPDWERASRGLLAVAINNQDGAFAKRYDLGRPDDAVVLSLFKGVDYWVLGVEDADAIVLHAAAACDSRDATEPIGRAIDSLLKLARDVVEHPDPEALAAGDRILRMAEALLANVRVERTDRSVNVRAEGFGTLVDLASIVGAQAGRAKSQEPGGGDGPEDSKR